MNKNIVVAVVLVIIAVCGIGYNFVGKTNTVVSDTTTVDTLVDTTKVDTVIVSDSVDTVKTDSAN